MNGTGRYEGSNKLGKARSARWLPTWNVAGAWLAHEERWFKGIFNPILVVPPAKTPCNFLLAISSAVCIRATILGDPLQVFPNRVFLSRIWKIVN